MEGGGNRVVMVVPSKQLVVFRHGKSSPDWDQAYLVNRLLRKQPGPAPTAGAPCRTLPTRRSDWV